MTTKTHTPKFLLAFDRDFEKKYVVHTQDPMLIAEVKEGPNDRFIDLEVVTHDSQAHTQGADRLAGLMRRMADWYRSTLKT
ncbi:MAG: hypothetical protein IH597_14935 [Bacteroidales bacterium]|nr:hypothetical protein [Bacteroidales bacterium]